MTTATAPAPAISREILEERWLGLVIKTNPLSPVHDAPHVENSKAWDKLDQALERLVYGLVRSDVHVEETTAIISQLHGVVREEAIRLVEEAGIAQATR